MHLYVHPYGSPEFSSIQVSLGTATQRRKMLVTAEETQEVDTVQVAVAVLDGEKNPCPAFTE
jgi:hypothetical protein